MHEATGGLELIQKGGFMMYPLLLSAVMALTVIFERLYAFHFRYKAPNDFIFNTLSAATGGELDAARKSCDEIPAPISAVLAAGLRTITLPREEMELAMKNEAERWVPRLERRIEVIDTVITAAPLMGLLGTITGMMSSFQVLSAKGVNEPNAITGGVAEALIATATGLIIALLCLVAYNYLSNQVKHFIYELESVSSQLLEARLSLDRKRRPS